MHALRELRACVQMWRQVSMLKYTQEGDFGVFRTAQPGDKCPLVLQPASFFRQV